MQRGLKAKKCVYSMCQGGGLQIFLSTNGGAKDSLGTQASAFSASIKEQRSVHIAPAG